jgi:hypothetical protein
LIPIQIDMTYLILRKASAKPNVWREKSKREKIYRNPTIAPLCART